MVDSGVIKKREERINKENMIVRLGDCKMEAEDKIRIDQMESKIVLLEKILYECKEIIKIQSESFKEVATSLEYNISIIAKLRGEIDDIKNHINCESAHEI